MRSVRESDFRSLIGEKGVVPPRKCTEYRPLLCFRVGVGDDISVSKQHKSPK